MNQLSLLLIVIGIAISSPLPAAMVFNPDEDIMTSSFFFPPNSVHGYAGEGRHVFRVSNNDTFGLTGKNDNSGTDFLHGFLNNTEAPGSTFLIINPIPEPATGILALVGIALTLGRRIRQS